VEGIEGPANASRLRKLPNYQSGPVRNQLTEGESVLGMTLNRLICDRVYREELCTYSNIIMSQQTYESDSTNTAQATL
jgi:hypothetical protein